jgi:hypothetical protein
MTSFEVVREDVLDIGGTVPAPGARASHVADVVQASRPALAGLFDDVLGHMLAYADDRGHESPSTW